MRSTSIANTETGFDRDNAVSGGPDGVMRGLAGTPRVLLVTGAYYPEISAAATQCRAVAAALRGRVRFSVLTTALDLSLPAAAVVDEVTVSRVTVNVRSFLSKASASLRSVRDILHETRACDVVHLHGCSQKNVLVTAFARLLGKPVVLTLHTAGQDEPQAVRLRGRLAYWAFMSADLVLCVSPSLRARCREADLAEDRVRLTPNGVDTRRFRPADPGERPSLRRALGWPDTQPVVLFVGFFSRDKRPDLLFRAWRRLINEGIHTRLVYVGAKGTSYYEIDESLVLQIRREAAELGRPDDVEYVEPTHDIEPYFRAADVFVLPSVREAHPMALLEAMASGLPSIATRLPGSTDVCVEDGLNGRLVPPDDEGCLADALRQALADRPAAWLMGSRARETVTARYDVGRTAEQWLSAYRAVLTEYR